MTAGVAMTFVGFVGYSHAKSMHVHVAHDETSRGLLGEAVQEDETKQQTR